MSINLSEYGIFDENGFYEEAFSRNIGLLTAQEQDILRQSRVAIPGMGGVGGIHLVTMARSGIGKATISDFDHFEPANTNRQYGANTSSYGRSKLEVMKEQALLINPYMKINTFPGGISEKNIDEFLSGVDMVLDGLDFFNFETRRLLFTKAREKGIHIITAGPMGYSSAMLVFSPVKGMSFDEYFNISDKLSYEEKILSFALGLAPRPTHIKYMDFSKVDLSGQAGPSLAVSCQICGGMAGTEVLRILLNKKGLKPVPHYFQFDPYLMKLRKGKLSMGNKNPIQRAKIFVVQKMLESKRGIEKPAEPQYPEILFDGSKRLNNDTVSYLIDAAIQAPSGDNAQPWRFKVEDNCISIKVDSGADHSFFNVNQAASKISCGAAAENIMIAATRLGLKPEIKSVLEQDEVGAEISISNEAAKADPLADYIWKRHTNRTFYKSEFLSSQVIEQCQTAMRSIPGSRLYTITRRDDIKKLGKIISSIDRIRTENRLLHEHLNKMIRFTREEVDSTNDGLPLKNLQAGVAGEYFLKFSKPWPVMNILNKAGIGRLVAMHSYKGISNSSAIMLLTMDGTTNKKLFDGGRALQRIWLELTRLGYDVQPMTAITLFFLRFQFSLENELSNRHIQLFKGVRESYLNLFPGIDDNDGQIMLFRVGHGKKIKHLTKRKPIASFMEHEWP